MLPESRLYSFLDQSNGHALHFLEGQRLIADLALIHELDQSGLNCLREIVLALQPLIALLKNGEGLGLYLDIDEPYVRFKLETNFDGYMRTLLLPHGTTTIPSILKGLARISKLMPNQSTPYNSAIELSSCPTNDVANLFLQNSYQTPGKTILSPTSDQSLLVLQLPKPNVNKAEVVEREDIQEYASRIKTSISELFHLATTDGSIIIRHFEELGLLFLGSRQVKFKCSCTKDRMLQGLAALIQSSSFDEVFNNGTSNLELKCDYCNSFYLISRQQAHDYLQRIKGS